MVPEPGAVLELATAAAQHAPKLPAANGAALSGAAKAGLAAAVNIATAPVLRQAFGKRTQLPAAPPAAVAPHVLYGAASNPPRQTP